MDETIRWLQGRPYYDGQITERTGQDVTVQARYVDFDRSDGDADRDERSLDGR